MRAEQDGVGRAVMSGLIHPSVGWGAFPESHRELLKGKPHPQKLGPVGPGLQASVVVGQWSFPWIGGKGGLKLREG